MNSYRLKCKTKTECINPTVFITNKNRKTQRSNCKICSTAKSCFIKEIKGRDIVDVIGKNIGEIHFPGSNYLGPGTKFIERINREDKPVDRIDEAAMHHDLSYHIHKNKEKRHEADRKLLKDIDEIQNPTFTEKVKKITTKAVIKPKLYFGLGL